MTNFEDQLFSDLMTEYGAELRRLPQVGSEPARGTSGARRRRRLRRPAWLATGATALAAAATAVVMTLGGTAPAYAVTQGADGTIQVSVSQPSGVAGANAALRRLHVKVRVVPVRPGCPSVFSLPHPQFVAHPKVSVSAGKAGDGHHAVRVKVSGKGIPAGATLLLAFSDTGGGSLGVGGWITGPVPHCVSLAGGPAGPGGGAHSAG
jgi:hypothetical protein